MKPRILIFLCEILIVVAVLTLFLVFPPWANAQVMRYGVVMEPAAHELAAAWDDTSLTQHERGYCVQLYSIKTRTEGPGEIDTLFTVYNVEPAQVDSSAHGMISMKCHDGVPPMHTHPTVTCDDKGSCYRGGIEAYEAFPSRRDLYTCVSLNVPFCLIQVDRHVFRFYYPSDLQQLPVTRGQ